MRKKQDHREGLSNKDPEARWHVRPESDAERVLGQIERSEVRAGPEAAREIAAEHEEAYGDVWNKRAGLEDRAAGHREGVGPR